MLRDGIVEQVGEGVTRFKPGDHVVGCASGFCGHCKTCVQGFIQRCVEKPARGPKDAARHMLGAIAGLAYLLSVVTLRRRG